MKLAIKQWMKVHAVKNADLAKAMGMTNSSVAIMLQREDIRMSTLAKIARALGCKMKELFVEDGEMFAQSAGETNVVMMRPMIPDNIAELVKQYMNDTGTTSVQLAKRVGISESSVRSYFSKERKPRIKSLERLANGMGTTLDGIISCYTRNKPCIGIMDMYLDSNVKPAAMAERNKELWANRCNSGLATAMADDMEYNITLGEYLESLSKEEQIDLLGKTWDELRKK